MYAGFAENDGQYYSQEEVAWGYPDPDSGQLIAYYEFLDETELEAEEPPF